MVMIIGLIVLGLLTVAIGKTVSEWRRERRIHPVLTITAKDLNEWNEWMERNGK